MSYQTNLNRSPDANKIYDQYIAYYNDMASKIGAIDQLPHDKWIQKNVQDDRTLIAQSITNLGTIYQKDYDDSKATLQSFINDCASLETRVTAAFNNAMGQGSPLAQKIAADFNSAETLYASWPTRISQAQDLLNSLPSLKATLDNLSQKISAMPPGPAKDKAQKDLATAVAAYNQLQRDIVKALPNFGTIKDQLSLQTSVLAQLQELTTIPEPTAQDLQKADSLLSLIQAADAALSTFETNSLDPINQELFNVKTAIVAVQNDIQPTPTPGKRKNSCWVIDWTSWTFPVPEGVDTVNIFVGKLDMINGKPTVSGFGGLDQGNNLDQFVQACHAKNIEVKISLGGGGGSYDKCWDLLTKENVESFAKGLVDFCHTHHLQGVDFDYEEYAGPEQEALVGTLIKAFKTLDPNLQATLCTNAGSGPNFPWQAVVKNILDASMDGSKCPLDALYIMSYYQPQIQEEGWVSGWAEWLNQTYGLSKDQVGVGLDDFDAHAYNIDEFAHWAATHGFATAYWAWDPARPDQSNQSTLKIYNSYHSSTFGMMKRFGEMLDAILDLLFGPLFQIFEGFDEAKKIESEALPPAYNPEAFLPIPTAPPLEA